MPRETKAQRERREDDEVYGITKMGELAAYKRMVELYQAGAVIEYHDMPQARSNKIKRERFHVGFRYDCMSDDDYFELRALESHFAIKENPNWRGDPGTRMGRQARIVAAARA
jgi:hypothetical protein